jgi:hypothetical protein
MFLRHRQNRRTHRQNRRTHRQDSAPTEAASNAAAGEGSTTVELQIAAHIHLTLVTDGHTVTFLAATVGADEHAPLLVFDHRGGEDAAAHAEYVRAWADTPRLARPARPLRLIQS